MKDIRITMIPKAKCKSDLEEVAQKTEENISFNNYEKLREEHHASGSTIQKKFGGWNEAKEAANLDTVTKTSRSFSDDELLNTLRRKSKEVDGNLYKNKYEEIRGEGASARTYITRFGSWIEAQTKAGIETTSQKKNVNLDYFEDIDSETAYWIGFLVGDGSATTSFSLGLSAKDSAHLYEFRDAINSEHTIGEFVSSSGADIVQLTIGRNDFVNKVKSVIGGEDKTHSDSLPEIPEPEHCHFVRGLLDADGCIPKTEDGSVRLNISGHVPRLEKVAHILPVDVEPKETEKHQTANHGRIRIYGDDARSVIDWLYPQDEDTEPKLDRKCPM